MELYGLSPTGAVLVRPDGHVAWRAHAADTAASPTAGPAVSTAAGPAADPAAGPTAGLRLVLDGLPGRRLPASVAG